MIGKVDWAATPLGPIEDWLPGLRIALSICEHCSLASALYWGPEHRLIHNEAWRQLLGDDCEPGQPAHECETALWPVVEPLVRQVFDTGEAAFLRERPFTLIRDDRPEETYWNCSLTPIMGDDGKVAGVLNQVNEVTRTMLAERRLSFQISLADRLRGLGNPTEIKKAAIELLGQYLDAARVGYAEVDAEQRTLTVRREWAREGVPSLAGQATLISDLGEGTADFLQAGEPLAMSDLHAFGNLMSPDQLEAWEATGTRAMIVVPLVRQGALQAVLYAHDAVPRSWKRSEVAIARDVAERTWDALERAQAEQSLRESEDHYRHAVELNPQVSWTAHPDGQLNRVARRWHDWTGTTGLGDSWAKAIHPDDRERSFEVWSHSIRTGEPYDIEHRVRQRDGSHRWARSRAFPRRDSGGDICLWYGATEDIHERKIAEERQRLLVNELNHRVKNTLATVQAIAFQTLKGSISPAEARTRFEARLMALSRAHNLLTEQNWEGASLERIVADATAHLAEEQGRFELHGDSIWVAPRAALGLTLALHELSTNAAKYGALSNDAGRISIGWSIEGGNLTLEWRERDGPAVTQPSRRGFGSRLIERGLEADLGGKATMMFEPTGLCCIIEASLEAVQAKEAKFG